MRSRRTLSSRPRLHGRRRPVRRMGELTTRSPKKVAASMCHCAANWTTKPEASDPNRRILSDAPVIGCLVGDHAAGSPSGTYSPGVRVAEDAMAGPPPSAQPLSAPSTGGLLPYHLQRPIRCMPSRYCGCGLPFVGAGESELDVGPPPVATNGSVLANCSWSAAASRPCWRCPQS